MNEPMADKSDAKQWGWQTIAQTVIVLLLLYVASIRLFHWAWLYDLISQETFNRIAPIYAPLHWLEVHDATFGRCLNWWQVVKR